MKAGKNANLQQAKRAKYDEFYTQLADIENEVRHYAEHFRGKVVYCNCDALASRGSFTTSRTSSRAWASRN